MSSEETNKFTAIPSTDGGGGGGDALQASNASESQEHQNAVTPTVSDILQQIENSADPKPQETESSADPKPKETENSAGPKPKETESSADLKPQQTGSSTDPKPQETESSADPKPQETESSADPKPQETESSADPKPQQTESSADLKPQQTGSSTDPKPQETESSADPKPQQPAFVERANQEIRAPFNQQQGGSNEPEMIDFCSAERVTLVRKIRIPHPSLKGSIIGRGGETIAAMRKTYQCKFYMLGAGSTKDAGNERELLESGAEEHQHLAEPLHVKIECNGPASVVYPRVQAAMEIFNQLFNEGNGAGTMGAPIQMQTPQQRHVPPPTHYSTPAPFDPQQGYRAQMTDAMAMDVSVPPPLQRPQQLGSGGMGRAMGRGTTGIRGGGAMTEHTYRGGVQKRERPSPVGQGSYHQQQGQHAWGTGQSSGRGGTSNFDYSNPTRGYGSSGVGRGGVSDYSNPMRGGGSDYSNPMRGGYGNSDGGRGGVSDYSNPMRGGYGTSSSGGIGRGGGSDYSNPMRGGYGNSDGGRGGSSQTRGGPNPGYGGRGGASYH